MLNKRTFKLSVGPGTLSSGPGCDDGGGGEGGGGISDGGGGGVWGGGCGEGGGSRRWWRWQGLVWLPRWQKFVEATAFNRRVAW